MPSPMAKATEHSHIDGFPIIFRMGSWSMGRCAALSKCRRRQKNLLLRMRQQAWRTGLHYDVRPSQIPKSLLGKILQAPAAKDTPPGSFSAARAIQQAKQGRERSSLGVNYQQIAALDVYTSQTLKLTSPEELAIISRDGCWGSP
jgi:hypothetical protein